MQKKLFLLILTFLEFTLYNDGILIIFLFIYFFFDLIVIAI